MKKKVFSLLLALLIIMGSMPLTLLSVAAEGVVAAAESIAAAAESIAPAASTEYDPTKPLVIIVPVTSYPTTSLRDPAPARPDASGYAHFYITAVPIEGKTHIDEDITVNYYTEDKSALASAGDYEAASGTVVLTKEENTVEIVIKTSMADYSINLNVIGGRENYNYISRSFLVKIDVVSGLARVDDRTVVECALLAEHNLQAYKYSNATVLAPYTSYGNYNLSNVLVTDPCAEGEVYTKNVPLNFPASWAADYVGSDIDANVYMALRNAHIDEHWNNSTYGISASIGGVVVDLNGEFHDSVFGWGPAILGIDGRDSKYVDYLKNNYVNTHIPAFDKTLQNLLTEESIKKALNNNYVIRRKWDSYGEPDASSQDPNEFYVGLRDNVLSWNELEIRLESFGGRDRKLSGGSVTFRLEDISDPQVETTEDGKYVVYHNFDTAVKGDKLHVAIRFNEPVQVVGKEPYFMGKVNGVGTGTEPHPYAIKFNYVGGSGTDTLYFEGVYNGDYHITSITGINFKYADSIKDFAGVANSFVVPSDFAIDGFNLDKRQPLISVSANDAGTSGYVTSKTIEVTVSKISEAADLYYAWTDSEVAPTSFVNKLTVVGSKSEDYATAHITGNGDGVKYLHLKVVTRYGQVQTNVKAVNNNASSDTKQYLGPYKFDNTPPSVDESKLVPKEGSTLEQKVYIIPSLKNSDIPFLENPDPSTGFNEIKMYYVGEDGKNYLISDKTLTYKSFEKDTPVEIYLNAAEVGVKENQRRDVTIFFTLTDILGNTDEDVARHQVTFDTNTYIDIESVNIADDFRGKTEIIDEGYIFIYSGNASGTVNADNLYYSLTLNVLKENLAGNPEIIIRKNGNKIESGYTATGLSNLDQVDPESVVNVKIDFTKPMGEGYYEIQIYSYEDPDDKEGGPDLVSKIYKLYVGTGKGELDEIVNNGTVLINKVYQLPSPSYFYYMDNSGSVGTVRREMYNNTALSASFSSIDKLREYLLFNEYRDLYAVTLTADLAQALNDGQYAVQKASDKEPVAMEGQVWIRYKSSSWSVETPYDKTKWVYYYYGTREALDISLFSDDLKKALNSAVDSIADRAKEATLPELSAFNGQGLMYLTEKLGPPTLAPEQIHSKDKLLSDESCNSKFATVVMYRGDSAIYSSEIVLNGVKYILIGNVVIPTGSRLQYKYLDESGINGSWVELDYSNGQRFGDVFRETGRYSIRELGSGGVSVFNVYIDKDAPMVTISWKGSNGATNTQTLSKFSEKEFRSSSIKIVGIDAREYDKYSYVALYSSKNFVLHGVYRMTDLQSSPVDIPDGDYYMVISDRGGNSYVMTIRINSTALNCEITESSNVKIKFSCNRQPSEIQDFYVKRNGILVSGKYANALEFTASGTYEFYVKDIYGNVYGPELYNFSRIYPEVEWKFRNESGQYITYNDKNKTKQFNLEKVTDGAFTTSSSTSLKFKISGDYGYTFLGNVPEHDENLKDSTVTLKTIQTFQLKVYYKKHPEVYTIYNCVVDTSAPTIDVSIQADAPVPDELAELRKAAEAVTEVVEGNRLIPSKISYSATSIQTKYIANGDCVLSDLIKVNAYDDGGLSYVHVYHNGELIKTQEGTGFTAEIALSKAGEYRIVAEDILGNKSEFSFTNSVPNSFNYVVDGMPITLGLHDFENFDENGNYLDSTFGNEYSYFIIYEDVDLYYMITDTEGNKHFVAFVVRGSEIREAYYCLDSNKNIVFKMSEEALFNGPDNKATVDKEYVLYEIKNTDIKIYAKVNSYGNVSLKVYAPETSAITVETRLNTQDREFYYAKTELSSFSANLTLKTDELVEFTETNELIKLNRSFFISESNFDADKMDYVEVYYSKTNDFADWGYIFKEEIYEPGKEFKDEGFYYVRLINKYNNESAFTIHISYKFAVASYVEFADGEKAHFSSEYNEPIYSNGKVIFEVYANGADISVKKDGVDYQPVISIDGGITYVILSEDGSYTVSFFDAYRNVVERSAVINSNNRGFNESLLTGYNENALKKADGYTNKVLSVDKSVLEAEGICYLEIQYGDSFEVIFDCISEDAVALDESKLINCIGSLGDGIYTVTMRDRYGTILTKVIHYRSTPTLKLEREIRTSLDPESYDIEQALLVGFWSNSALIFKTDAEVYQFTVNNDKTECPNTLTFASYDQQGRLEYDITYVDEYGFSYSFKAYLVRQELEVLPEIEGEEIDIDGVLTTTGGVAVSFSQNAYCTYTWNNSEERVYTPGEVLTRDGVYRFTVTDYAGNVAAITIKKDNVVEFEFTDTNSSAVVQSGMVVNSSKVGFMPLNGDSAYIEKVYRNGVLQTNYDSSKFTEDGKWEFIISDKLGNKSYYCFYIVSKQKSSFAYTTPYEYQVTELWYDSGDGVKISYLKFVSQGENTSSFEFAENGKYTVVMTSTVTGSISEFEFTINKNAPVVSLVGCNVGETTINDVTISGCVVGDKIKVYRETRSGEELVQEIEVATVLTKMPTITEGGKYRIVVESEAGVQTELSFVRKHVMNTEGSIFIMIIIGVAVVGLFTGLVYRNKSRTDK